MSTIHFLNVLEGDCNIIQHDSGRVTVIDVSNAYNDEDTLEEKAVKASEFRKQMFTRTHVPAGKIDYGQKKTPDNPIDYLKNNIKTSDIFRFIITHPDMDHLDGIKDFYSEFKITNTWDTPNNKLIDLNSGFFGGYNKDDWKFYTQLRGGSVQGTKRLNLYAGDEGTYWADDNIKILCPTKTTVQDGNNSGDHNDASYVLLYTPPKKDGKQWKILFAGDSHDQSWDYILKNFKAEVSNVDILFAPHHGRDSKRNYTFLQTLNPRITLFGNASSVHLAYAKYPETRITNNQAGFVVLNVDENGINVYVKNHEFAYNFRKNPKRNWGDPTFDENLKAYYLCSLQ